MQIMRQLLANKDKNGIMLQALDIYHRIEGKKNFHSVNALLSIASLCEAEKVIDIWDDIKFENVKNISYSLLLTCCSNALKKDLCPSEFMEILKFIESDIENKHEKDIVTLKTNLIMLYGKCSLCDDGLIVFESMLNEHKDAVCIGAMMKVLLDHQRYDELIEIYQQHNVKNDIILNLVIKACTNSNNEEIGQKIIQSQVNTHSKLHSQQLLNTLIGFYGRFANMDEAWKIFDSIPIKKKDVITVTAMMKCCVDNNDYKNAIALYQKYKVVNDDRSHNLAIKAFMHLKNYDSVKELIESEFHGYYTKSVELKNTLIDFHGAIGNLKDAVNLFRSIAHHEKGVVSVGAMMKCFIANNEYSKALDLYYLFIDGKKESDCIEYSVCHTLALIACEKLNDFECGQCIIQGINLKQCSVNLLNALINFYAMFGEVASAKNIFETIPDNAKDAVSVGSMMKCLINNGQNEDSYKLYKQYKKLHNDTLHMQAIKACIQMDAMKKGKRIIDKIKDMDNTSIGLRNTVINFYGHFGDIEYAQNVFNTMANKTADSLNCLMQALNDNNLYARSLKLYQESDECDDISHVFALKACMELNEFEKGRTIISKHIDKEVSIELLNSAIHFYGFCNDVQSALAVFDSIAQIKKDAVTVNNMMNCYINNNCVEDALSLYHSYSALNDDISHAIAIKGMMINGCFSQQFDFDHSNLSIEVKNTLLDFYAESGEISNAWNIFNSIADDMKDVICINNMMKCCINNDQHTEALSLYQQFDALVDDVSHLLIIHSCINQKDFENGKQIIDSKIDYASNQHVINLMNALIDFYGHLGDIKQAKTVFNTIPNETKNIISFGSMMNAYCLNDLDEQCILLFDKILSGQFENIFPNKITGAIALKAATNTTSLHFGQRIYKYLKHRNNVHLLSDLGIQICLISLYGKCSDLEECNQMFDKIKSEEFDKYNSEISLWNAMINAYARNGKSEEAFDLFERMNNETSLNPNYKTFCILLNAMSHSGDIDRAKKIWNSINDEQIKHSVDVNTAFVDCLARKGMIDEAYDAVLNLESNLADKGNDDKLKLPWMSLLGHSRKHKNDVMTKIIYRDIQNRFGRETPVLLSKSDN